MSAEKFQNTSRQEDSAKFRAASGRMAERASKDKAFAIELFRNIGYFDMVPEAEARMTKAAEIEKTKSNPKSGRTNKTPKKSRDGA